MPTTSSTPRRCLPLVACWLALTPFAALADPPATTPTKDDTFLRDYAETRGFMLGRPVNATPTPDGSAVLFLRAKGPREPSQELYEFDVASKQTRRLLAPEDALKGAAESLSPEEKARRERQRISVGGFTAFSISKNSALVLLSLSGKLYLLDRPTGSVRELASGAGTIVDPKFSPDSKCVAYVRNQDVCVFNLANGKEIAVTTGGTETISHGLAEFVAQEEMARFSGYWWSPDSRRIVYEEADATKVESWYVVDPAQPGNEPARTYYPRPGKENVTTRLGITDADGNGVTVWVDWDRTKYPYLGKVTWGEYGPLTLTVLSRAQTELALLKADPIWGDTSALLTEHDDAWVKLPQDVPVWLSAENGGGFLWASERTGRRKLERRASDGHFVGLVPAYWEDHFLSLISVAGDRIYVTYEPQQHEYSESPFVTAIGSVKIADPTAADHDNDISQSPGLYQGNFGDSKTVLAVQEQTASAMPRTIILKVDDNLVLGELPSVAVEPPAAPKTTLCEVVGESSGSARKANSFFAVLVRPHDFDPVIQYRYPVIVDVYGGPEHQQVVGAMRPYLLDQWIADQGFIVVAIDGRGTPARGRDWERAIAGHFGSVPLDDQIAALKALGAQFPEMDMDRIGITGWSFGGYLSALAVLRRPDIFKAGVAGAPVAEWMDYDTCYTERYLGVPGAGRWPDAYKEGSLLTYAADLKRPLLVIHGTADDNVYLRHSLELMNAFFRAGKPAEFLPLSSFTHMVPDPVVRSRLEQRIVEFFREHLKNPD